jgi:hypothetical protein
LLTNMSRYLAVLLWAVVIAAFLGIALLLTRRTMPAHARPAAAATGNGDAGATPSRWWPVVVLRSGSAAVIGTAVVFGIMALLGLLVVHHGLAIDKPIYRWMVSHRVHSWAAVMKRLTKIGDTWTCWAAAVSAAVCLAVAVRRLRWLMPALFATVIVVDHYTTLALRHVFHRPGPPDSPLGTYPSGGCDRVILFYGLIAYLLWREFSGTRRAGIWAAAIVTSLGFNEAYSRVYLTLHWFTDALSGLLYGGLLLAVFIAAFRIAAGSRPAASRDRPGQGGRLAAARRP